MHDHKQPATMTPVYLTETELRRMLDRTAFSPGTQGYSEETYQTALKLASALLVLLAAPELEVAKMLMPGKADKVDVP